jgi:hypothetical protein
MQAATKTIGELVQEVLAKRDASETLFAEKKRIDSECMELERELSDLMDEQGLQSLKASDGRTLYKSRDLFVNVPAANREAVVEACRLLGLDQLVVTSVNSNSLKSQVREWMGDVGDEEQIPEQLRSLVAVHEEYSIRVRKS